jgi:integration host factor subunit beta
MSAALTEGDRVEIRGVGSLNLNYCPRLVGLNPKTGKRVEVPAK